MSGNYTFYTGRVWVDQTDGRHIITLKKVPAGALQAAIPLFISLVGKVFWNFIRRFWYHVHFLRGGKRDRRGLKEQHHDILLYNSTGGLSTSLNAAKLWHAWRRNPAPRTFRTFATLACATALYWTLWIAASALSFFIWQDQVTDLALIRSSNCGILNPDADLVTSLQLYQSLLAETWVTQCYGEAHPNPGACNLYAKQSLSSTSRRGVLCPFRSEDLCVSNNSSPHEMDAGPIDSHLDLGINAPPEDRVTYRKVTTCSPIRLGRFQQVMLSNESDEAWYWPNITYLQRFFLGPTNLGSPTSSPFTFEYNTAASLHDFSYHVTAFTYTPDVNETEYNAAPSRQWRPNSTLIDRHDADISLFFLASNKLRYMKSTDDPWFMANEAIHLNSTGDGLTVYQPYYYVNAIGCLETHQFCNPTHGGSSACSAPAGWHQAKDRIQNSVLAFNPAQMATAERIILNLGYASIYQSLYTRGASMLLASATVHNLVQTEALPVDQWRAEVEHWQAVSLAKLQRAVVDYAGGPLDGSLDGSVQKPFSPELEHQCESQMLKLASDYVNFNFDAIMVIVAIGFVLILIGLLYEPLLGWCLRGSKREGQLAWIANGPYQLQYHAYVGKGVKSWRDIEEQIPTTKNAVPRLHSFL